MDVSTKKQINGRGQIRLTLPGYSTRIPDLRKEIDEPQMTRIGTDQGRKESVSICVIRGPKLAEQRKPLEPIQPLE